jgi:hypothetical protein
VPVTNAGTGSVTLNVEGRDRASANDCLPATWRLRVVANSPNPATYMVGFSTLV